MDIEHNKAIVNTWIEAWRRGNSSSFDQIFAQNYTVNDVLIGIGGVQQAVKMLHSAFTDISFELNELVAERDKVVARWKVRGKHSGAFMGISPTGKQVELHGINIYQIVDGRIAANHEETNILEVIQDLKSGD